MSEKKLNVAGADLLFPVGWEFSRKICSVIINSKLNNWQLGVGFNNRSTLALPLPARSEVFTAVIEDPG
jgi:hypothetical protein